VSLSRAGRPEPDQDRGSSGETLQLLVGGGGGEPEMLFLLERPGADGRVRARSWTSNDWSSPPARSERDACELLRDIERWSRTGRTLNQPLTVVREWLEG